MSALPVAFHEVVVAPLAFGLAFLHARSALGGARAAVELLALAAYGFALERLAIVAFASHGYGDAWRLAPLGVPVAVAAVWAALIVSAMATAARLGCSSPLSRGAGAAILGIALDLLMEPVAVRAGLWQWTPPGPWLGVPMGNFVGWAVIVGSYTVGAERWSGGGTLARQAASRVALGAASIAVLLLVGVAWRGVSAERVFQGGAGWAAWAGLLALAAGLGLQPLKVPPTATLAGRLAAVPGPLPALVFLVVGAAFVTDAVRLGDPELRIAAVGSAAALLIALVRAFGRDIVREWQEDARARISSVQGLIVVLMKPRNGEAWSNADKDLLGRELKALARWTPTLLLLALPGGLLLVPLYARLLDRRRSPR